MKEEILKSLLPSPRQQNIGEEKEGSLHSKRGRRREERKFSRRKGRKRKRHHTSIGDKKRKRKDKVYRSFHSSVKFRGHGRGRGLKNRKEIRPSP